jgi:hypothetical protein
MPTRSVAMASAQPCLRLAGSLCAFRLPLSIRNPAARRSLGDLKRPPPRRRDSPSGHGLRAPYLRMSVGAVFISALVYSMVRWRNCHPRSVTPISNDIPGHGYSRSSRIPYPMETRARCTFITSNAPPHGILHQRRTTTDHPRA